MRYCLMLSVLFCFGCTLPERQTIGQQFTEIAPMVGQSVSSIVIKAISGELSEQRDNLRDAAIRGAIEGVTTEVPKILSEQEGEHTVATGLTAVIAAAIAAMAGYATGDNRGFKKGLAIPQPGVASGGDGLKRSESGRVIG